MSNFLSATMLIPACSIGAGLLSFPVLTGLSGFLPSTISIIICWVFITATGIIITDLCYMTRERKQKTELHFFSINEQFLPPLLRTLSLGLFLFMSYGSLIGYTDAISPTYKAFFPSSISNKSIGLIGLIILFAFSHLSNKLLCKINAILVPFMFIAYAALLFFGFSSYNSSNLAHVDFSLIHTSIPIIITAFSYQFMIPTVANMLQTSRKVTKTAIVIGTSINCLIYIIWNFTMLGCIPMSALLTAYQTASPITSVLSGAWLTLSGNIFAIFTLLTSFISITICIIDYWKDHIKTENKFILSSSVFMPVAIAFLAFDKLFLWIFSVTGGYGDTVLFGLLPIYMLFNAKHQGIPLPFSKHTLVIIAVIACSIFGIQLSLDFGSFFK